MFRLDHFYYYLLYLQPSYLAACGSSNDQAEGNKVDDKKEDTSYTIEHAMGTTKLEKTA